MSNPAAKSELQVRQTIHKRNISSGFTLVELLTVITIIGVLVSLLLPAVQAAREASRTTQCSSRLRQIMLGMAMHESQTKRFPPGRMGCSSTTGAVPAFPDIPCSSLKIPNRLCGASGLVPILPYVEQGDLLAALDARQGGLWVDNLNQPGWIQDSSQRKRSALNSRPPVFVCPSAIADPISTVYGQLADAATTNYALSSGRLGPDADADRAKYENDGVFIYAKPRKQTDIRDGLSHTLFIGEVTHADAWESSNIWTYGRVHADTLRSTRNPLNTAPGTGIIRNRRNGAFGSRHVGGGYFAFGDGRVTFLSDSIDRDVYRSASAINDGSAFPLQ